MQEEANATELAVKLEYHEEAKIAAAAAKIQAATAKMKIGKELIMAKARLQVFKEEEMSQELGPEVLSEEDSQIKVQRFIESLPVQPDTSQNTATMTTTTVATTTIVGVYDSKMTAALGTTKDRNRQGLNPNAPPFPTTSQTDNQRTGYHPPLMSTGCSPMVPPMSRSRSYVPDGFKSVYRQMQSTTESVHCDFRDPLGGYNTTVNEPAGNYTPSGLMPEHVRMPTISETETQQPKSSIDNATDSGLETMIKLMGKPCPDIDKFDGNALLYRRFVRQFNNYVSAFCDKDHERLTCLEKFATGEAHRVVMGY